MKKSGLPRGWLAMRLFIFCAFLYSGWNLDAATLEVTSLADSGPGTLREAVLFSQSGDTITFGVSGTITLTNYDPLAYDGDLIIDKDLHIVGPGTNLLSIIERGHPTFPILVTSNATVSVSDLTFAGTHLHGAIWNIGHLEVLHCVFTNCQGEFWGGAIVNGGDLTLMASLIINCYSYYGGGIYSDSRNLTLIDSTITGCAAYYSGGGVMCYGPLTLRGCNISGNIGGEGNVACGGGILVSGDAVIDRCTINNNLVYGDELEAGSGGGIYSRNGVLRITNSTVSGNISKSVVAGTGGGIQADAVQLESCTVVSNRVENEWGILHNAPSPDLGGGIAAGSLQVRNSIIAQNISAFWHGLVPVPADCSGAVVSLGYNLIQDTNNCTITGDFTGNIYGKDPLLGPLQDNGGPTFTHALLPGSPAIDAGSPTSALTVDQRGFLRPQDGNGDGLAIPDIGAFEKETLCVWIKSITVQGGVRLIVSGAPGQLYAVQSSESLTSPQWDTLPAVTADLDGMFTLVDGRERSAKSRYYRIIRVPVP